MSQNHTLQVLIHKEGFTNIITITCDIDSEVVPHLPSAVHHGQGVQAGQRFVNLREKLSLVSLIKSIQICITTAKKNLIKENLVLA